LTAYQLLDEILIVHREFKCTLLKLVICKRESIHGDNDMKTKNYRLVIIFLAAAVILCGLALAQVSESTKIYASLPAKIEISIPPQYKDLQMGSCEPDKSISVAGGIEVKSNTNWGLTVAGSTSSGHMVGSDGSPVHELHSPMTVRAQNPAGDLVSIPGTNSNPTSTALLSDMGPANTRQNAIGLTFEQLFGWNDPADDGYQITVTLTATPA
jgi:hypothetical protein